MKRGLSTGDITAALVNDGNEDDRFTTQPKTRSKKAKKTTNPKNVGTKVSEPESASSAANINDSSSTPTTSANTEAYSLKLTVDRLLAQVNLQSRNIQLLTDRLNFISSMFGVPELVSDLLSVQSNLSGPVSGIQPTSLLSSEHTGWPPLDVRSHPPANTDSSPTALHTSWSQAVTINNQLHQRQAQKSFRESVVTAVYVDKQTKDSRASNVVISGLPPNPQRSDKDAVRSLLQSELKVVTDVKHCRRLGTQSHGRVQPLLVVLPSDDIAAQVLSLAKTLRNSANVEVRDSVYINPNLTKAEARAAYEVRCRRRERRQQQSQRPDIERSDNLQPNSEPQRSSSSRPTVPTTASMSQFTGTNHITASYPSYDGLNASASVFTPAASATDQLSPAGGS